MKLISKRSNFKGFNGFTQKIYFQPRKAALIVFN